MTIDFNKLSIKRINILIVLLVFIIYGNGINNEYSLDDNIVVDGSQRVEEGLKSIPQIFKTRYAQDQKQKYDYRPIVITSFAIEKQFFRKLPPFQTPKEKERNDKLTQANISHFINIVLYAITCILLFGLLRDVFSNYNLLLPLIVTLLYLIHPLHTEVVDNIKSRDELFMFLFMLMAIKYYLKYGITSQIKYMIIAPVFLILSVLSKKNGIAIVGILPVLMYFKKIDYKKILIVVGTFFMVGLCYVLLKKGLITQKGVREFNYFENPLIFEDGLIKRITVGLYCSFFYLKMLIFPVNLSFYYGYNQIPMATFKDWEVWAGLLIFIPGAIYGLKELIKRNVIGLGIVLWLGLMLMVINVLFPIVGIVADRFTYMFSLGFCIVVGYLLLKLFKVDLSTDTKRIKLPSAFVMIVLGVTVLYAGRTIARNPDWHDYLTLYTNDLEHLDKSAKAHALWSNTYYPVLRNQRKTKMIDANFEKDVDKLIFHYKEALKIDSAYLTSINNLGSAFLNFKNMPDSTIKYCSKAVEIDPEYEEAHLNLAVAYNSIGKYDLSMNHYAIVFELNPDNSRAYNEFNNVAIKNSRVKKAIELLIKVVEKNPDSKSVYVNIANLYSMDNYDVKSSLYYFEKAFELDRNDKRLCSHIIKLHNSLGNTQKAAEYTSYL